jgi:uncharacterized damage-inducible protein DinB
MNTANPSKPLTSDPIDLLLGHNRWANGEVLRACEPLSETEFHQRFDIGPGSLHDTMSHVIGAIFRWADRIGQRPLRPSIEGRTHGDTSTPMTRRTPRELLALNAQACEDFAAVVRSVRPVMAEVRDWTFGGNTYRLNVAASIIHITNHGVHHRAQCMNMLRRLGRPVDADLDELEWQVAGEPID